MGADGVPRAPAEVVVPEAFGGERLDRAVATLAGVSRSEAAAWIDAGAVTLDGRPARVRSVRLRPGQRVGHPVPTETAAAVEPETGGWPPGLRLVHVDDHLIVVDKPAGMVVHPGAGVRRGTLVGHLLERFADLADVGDPGRPGVVHRLDATTSGLLIVARTPAAHAALTDALRRREVTRRYLAVLRGVPETDTGLIDAPVGRDPRHRTRMAVTRSGREARTRFRVLAAGGRPPRSVVEATLETGRTHQIRVHFAAIGHPLVGDTRYGAPAGEADRPLLHAAALAFTHPVEGRRLELISPPPADLVEGAGPTGWRPGEPSAP